MFTGIVQSVGIVQQIKDAPSIIRLCIQDRHTAARVKKGSSVAVQGVCLTVAHKSSGIMTFDVVSETLAKTTLNALKKGSRVNLEPALRVGDELGGHMVSGHIDGIGRVNVKKTQKSIIITVFPPKKLLSFIVPQGSVTLNGVSLTIAKKARGTFAVAIIPYTAAQTTLGELHTDDTVNIEVDMLMKYISHARRG